MQINIVSCYNKRTGVRLPVSKATYEEIKSHAIIQGESVNGFIKRAIAEAMERDKKQNNNINPL